jgi:ribosome-associated toxin RatA of RatAB toxin-antitoxin module
MKDINLHGNWFIKAPLLDVFNIITNFEKFPEYFPKVAESIRVTKREGNHLEMEATVKSFGQNKKTNIKEFKKLT